MGQESLKKMFSGVNQSRQNHSVENHHSLKETVYWLKKKHLKMINHRREIQSTLVRFNRFTFFLMAYELFKFCITFFQKILLSNTPTLKKKPFQEICGVVDKNIWTNKYNDTSHYKMYVFNLNKSPILLLPGHFHWTDKL